MLARKLISFACFIAMIGALTTVDARAANKEVVEFRLSTWKSAHFNSDKDSQKVFETLKQLGCEAKKHAHDGHTDVSYRCVSWKNIIAKTHEEAHKWEKWLQTYGFETKHVH